MTRLLLTLTAAALAATACQPAADSSTAALPDSTAVHNALRAQADAYEAAEVAGDAAATGQLYTDGATAAFEGLPTTTGRANIEALFGGYYADNDVTRADIQVLAAAAHSPTVATGGGSATFDVTTEGTSHTDVWRWAAEYQLGEDGVWRISYIIGFLEAAPPTS